MQTVEASKTTESALSRVPRDQLENLKTDKLWQAACREIESEMPYGLEWQNSGQQIDSSQESVDVLREPVMDRVLVMHLNNRCGTRTPVSQTTRASLRRTPSHVAIPGIPPKATVIARGVGATG